MIATRVSTRRLPVQPAVATVVIKMLGGTAIPDLTSWVELDPALALGVLQSANAPHLQRSNRVSSIRQAMVVLGTHAVDAIAAGRVASVVMDPSDPGSPEGYWARALSAAIGSRVIARMLDVNPDDAYTAGLVHDLGEIVLYRSDPERFIEVRAGTANVRSQLERERAAFGRTHTEVGTRLLKEWFVPDRIVRAVRAHHAAPEAVNGSVTRAVWAGIKLGQRVARVGVEDGVNPVTALRAVGVTDSVDRVSHEIERELTQLMRRLGGMR